jgi:hypothetical protein
MTLDSGALLWLEQEAQHNANAQLVLDWIRPHIETERYNEVAKQSMQRAIDEQNKNNVECVREFIHRGCTHEQKETDVCRTGKDSG